MMGLLNVSATGAEVDEVPAFAPVPTPDSPSLTPNGELTTDSNGNLWLFSTSVARTDAITVLRRTDAGWRLAFGRSLVEGR